ncbi:MAG: hypothetical protein IJX18_03325 [Clostridia bacterium]|nr:hypothetical protein [Clostridia bacterium]
MKTYFLSSVPCALVIGGAYFGRTDSFPRHADVCASDEVFVEFHPENALPIGFFITEDLPFCPPEKCEVYLLPDGIAIYAKEFTPCDFSLKVLLQQRLGDTTVTVFQQGAKQVCIESLGGMFVATLPPSFCPKKAERIGEFFLLVAPDRFCLLNEKAEIVLMEACEEVHIEAECLHALLPLENSRGRKAKCTWDLTGGDCVRKEFTLLQPTLQETEGLIAYGFFESLLIGADYTQFLSESLKKDQEKIPAFLGNFLSVLPTDKENACNLVYQKAERLFEIKTFRLQIEEDKIIDIQG